MKIAVIGIGNVGSTLGRRWAEVGHEVTFAVRNTNDPKAVAESNVTKVPVASIADAVANAEVVLLAVPYPAVCDAIAAAGNLTGKILLDCTNPLKSDFSGLELGTTTSAGEQVAQLAVGAKVVKIFNTTGAGNMAHPHYRDTRLTMLYAGDDAAAKTTAAELASDIGFDPVDLGPLSASRLLEPLALTWITLALKQKLGMDFGLNIIRRPKQ
jgi:8-hydroxy-5-deazaflavin:NADPH oxidoreductase